MQLKAGWNPDNSEMNQASKSMGYLKLRKKLK